MFQPWNPPASFASSSPTEYLLALAQFIDKYHFLYQYKSIEFFTKSVWNTIPPDWKEPLLTLSEGEAAIFSQGKVIKEEWPTSLQDFLKDVQRLVMPRSEVTDFSLSSSLVASIPIQSSANNAFSMPSLSRNMTAKKIHEVAKLSALIAGVAKKLGTYSVDVVDVGSGEGYLGQVLHHEYGMSVVGVDERSEFTEGAQQRAQYIRRESESRARKTAGTGGNEGSQEAAARTTSESDYKVKNVVACITLDMDPSTFEHIAWPTSPPEKAILVGLHTCGVLANAMLRLFMLSKRIHALVDVGCCYYRKQPDSEYELMSDAAKQFAQSYALHMTPGALKLACEAICRLESATKEDFAYSMESHFFRTLLETALIHHFQHGHKFSIRGLPRKKALSFDTYAKLAVDRMTRQLADASSTTPTTSTTTESKSPAHDPTIAKSKEKLEALKLELSTLYSTHKEFNPHVNVTLLLRSVMSPVLESFILLDRFLYLQELGAVPYLVPLFSELLSPRNMAIVAYKPP